MGEGSVTVHAVRVLTILCVDNNDTCSSDEQSTGKGRPEHVENRGGEVQ